MANEIRTTTGQSISAVIIMITRLAYYSMKYPKDKDLGAFYRSLSLNLASGCPDSSDAGQFAKELLNAAKIRLDKIIEKGRLGAEKRWGKNGKEDK